eukprot:341628_1
MMIHPLSVANDIYLLFIVRNALHILVLTHYPYTFNAVRLVYNFATNIALISIAAYTTHTNADEVNSLIALIAMSAILILCDLWMISSLTIQPNKVYNAFFEVDDELLTGLQYVGNHASDVPLDAIPQCISEMKRIYKSNVTRNRCKRKEQLQDLMKLIQENEQLICEALFHDFGRG